MSGTMIDRVVDQIITQIQGLSVPFTTAATLQIADGFPGSYEAPVLVSVGGQQAPTATGSQRWAGLGAYRKWEDFDVQIVVSAAYGGAGETGDVEGAGDTQKLARDQAFAVVNAIANNLRGDPTLSGLLSTLGGWVSVRDIHLKQTDVSNAAAGREAEVVMLVAVRARI